MTQDEIVALALSLIWPDDRMKVTRQGGPLENGTAWTEALNEHEAIVTELIAAARQYKETH